LKQSSTRIVFRLPFIAGIVIVVLMTLVLQEISKGINNHEPLTTTDILLSNWLSNHRISGLTTAMFVVTSLGSTVAASIIATAFGLFLLWKRRFGWLMTLVAAVVGGGVLNRLLKYFFQRQRPYFDDPILTLTSYSFPSGHTMMATVLYGAIAAYLIANARDWRARVLIIFTAGLLILLVGFSRIYLGAHYLSDVLGAFAEGLAWLSVCLTATYFTWSDKTASGQAVE
jgi:undecaprenyl-diphosphatase